MQENELIREVKEIIKSGDYNTAKKILEEFQTRNPGDKAAEFWLEACQSKEKRTSKVFLAIADTTRKRIGKNKTIQQKNFNQKKRNFSKDLRPKDLPKDTYFKNKTFSSYHLIYLCLMILGMLGTFGIMSLFITNVASAMAVPTQSTTSEQTARPTNTSTTVPTIQSSPTLENILETPVIENTASIASTTHTSTPTSLPPTSSPTATELSPTATPTLIPFTSGPITIGYSVLERPIQIYRFGFGENERMIIAGIHGGNEWNTVALADELIEYISDHPEIIPDDVTLFVLRNLNPDGEARAHNVDGRVNENGVDLNRNWPYNWKADWDRNGCWIWRPVTGGDYPASEPETQAALKFIQDHNIQAIINYHAAALGIFPGGLPPDDDSIRLAKALAAVSNYSYPPIDTGCESTGMLVDWASDKGIAAVDIELTNFVDTDFDANLKILSKLVNFKP